MSSQISIFFGSELPYETRTSLFIAFSLLRTQKIVGATSNQLQNPSDSKK